MKRLAVFDLDGTLVDSVPDILPALDRLVGARGRPPFSEAEVRRMIGDGARVLVTRAMEARGLPFSDAAVAEFLADYESCALDATRPYPGIPEALAALAAAGWRLAVCTNKPEKPAREVLEGLGLLHLFAAVGGGDTYAVRKPDPGHVLGVVAAAGARPEEAVMVGDMVNDVLSGRGAGLPVVFVAWGYGPLESADGAPVARDAAELPGFLEAALPAA